MTAFNVFNCENVDSILKKYFVYDKIFDLLKYDSDMSKLYDELKELKKDAYKENYRFIFLHYDTDYYITNNQPGLTLRNLQRILWGLDIDNFFCLVLSQQNLQPELDQLCVEETESDVPIACITHFLQDFLYDQKKDIDLSPNSIERNYICLNGAKRFHRSCIFLLLQHYNLLDKGLVSYAQHN
jgi:hypothetical protein